MSTAEAGAFHELILARLFGWSIALGPQDSKRGRRKQALPSADALFRELFIAKPSWAVSLTAMTAGEDVVELWPERLREVVRFQIDHKVPRVENEPTSAHYAETMREGGRIDYALPAFLADHGSTASVEDHPAWQHLVTGRAAA
ncbi:hypothetical protein [Aureimonas mangrovi]|uniref:hypothetical protein n=1 Tax=Aureimonas mangrovi TaxID=2758041 RepID=UPI00163DC2BA|nr:hypothetical protein [Aureimonas mangrovi]